MRLLWVGAPGIFSSEKAPSEFVLAAMTSSEMSTSVILISFCQSLIGCTGNGDPGHRLSGGEVVAWSRRIALSCSGQGGSLL